MTDKPNWLPIAQATRDTIASRGLPSIPQDRRDAMAELVEDELRAAENLQLVCEGADVGHLVQGLDDAVVQAKALVEQLRGWDNG